MLTSLRMNAPRVVSRRVWVLVSVCALVTAGFVTALGGSSPARAATTISVDSEATYRAALDTLSSDGSAGPHRIEITADFTITNPGDDEDPYYDGSEDLIIDGNGHTVTGSTGFDGSGVRFLHAEADGATVEILDLTVDSFQLTGEGFRQGAAVYSEEGDLDITDSTFSNNALTVTPVYFGASATSYAGEAEAYGGAVSVVDGDVNIEGSTFTGNTIAMTVTASDGSSYVEGNGGALYVGSGELHITDSEFEDNSIDGNSVITNADEDEASVILRGGAVYVDGDGEDVTIYAVFTGNSVDAYSSTDGDSSSAAEVEAYGGAVWVRDAVLSLSYLSSGATFLDNAVIARAVAPGTSGAGAYVSAAKGGALMFEGEELDGGGVSARNNSVEASAEADSGQAEAFAYGGAFYLEDLDFMGMVDLEFTGNEVSSEASSAIRNIAARANGGAISARDVVDVVIEDAVFTSNTSTATTRDEGDYVYAFARGGALHSIDTEWELASVTFTDNAVTANGEDNEYSVTSGALGGGIYLQGDSSIDMSSGVFEGNSADANASGAPEYALVRASGGAINNNGDDLDFSGVKFIDNSAHATGPEETDEAEARAWGGAVYHSSGDALIVFDGLFERNEAWATLHETTAENAVISARGGAIDIPVGTADREFERSTFVDNAVGFTNGVSAYDLELESFGGAIHAGDSIDVKNSTFVGNSESNVVGDVAGDLLGSPPGGGALVSSNGEVNIAFSTFVDNSGTFTDHVFGYDAIDTEGSVFSGGGTDACYSAGVVNSLGHNFDDEGSCTDTWDAGTDVGSAGADPMLGELGYSGGRVPTLDPLAGSPLIDAAGTSCSVSEDARGVLRPEGAACDIGAVEYLAPVTFTIPTDAGDIEGVAAGSTCAAGGIAWYAASDYATPLPAGVVAPFGVSTYSLCIPSPGGTLTVTLTLPAPVATVFKANAEDEWGEFDAVIDGNTLTLTLTDGGAGDYDGSVNGEIMDPVAPGFVLSLTG